MEIKDPGQARPQGQPQVITDKKKPGQNQTNAQPASPYSDTVELTDEVKQVHALHESIKQQPLKIDHKNVERLKQAIAEGKYQPKAEVLAEKIFQSELELQTTLEPMEQSLNREREPS